MTSLASPYSAWRWKLFLFWHIIALLALGSLLSPLWVPIDTHFFRFLNSSLKYSSAMRLFWAGANHRLADWVEDLCILAFYIAAILKAPKGMRKKRSAQMIFSAFLTAATILLINRFLCRDLLRLRRESPTLAFDNGILLSDYFDSFIVKVVSAKSFPGDHATTAILVTCSYAYFARGKLAILALIYGALLCLPRLVVGAHWLSDILVGSGAIALLSLSWAFCTPLADRSVALIEKLFDKCIKISR